MSKTQKILPAMISNSDVERVLALRESRAALKKRLALLDQALDAAEGDLTAKVDAGADLSQCGFIVSIREVQKRFPAWKEHFLNLAGKDAADRVLAETEPKTYRSLLIEGKE